MEIETQLTITENLGYLAQNQASPLLALAAELGKIINGLMGSIRSAA